jgi:multicomponent Na+:H+ antiporter subunit E
MSPSVRERRRRGFQWPVILFIVVVWNLLWGNVSVANVLSGLLVAILVVAVFPLPPILYTGRMRPVGLAKLVYWFVIDLVAASAQIAWLAIRPGPPPTSAVIEVTLFSDSDLYLTLTAEFVSLVPGSVIVDVHRASSTLYVHVVDVHGDADIAEARRRVLREERRVMEALASDEEMRAYRSAIAVSAQASSGGGKSE